MITQEAIYERARQMALRAKLPVAEMLHDAAIELQAELQQAIQSTAAQQERENPPPAHDWATDDYRERLSLAQLDRSFDPQRSAYAAGRRAQIEQEISAITAQIERYRAPLLARIRELSDELARL